MKLDFRQLFAAPDCLVFIPKKSARIFFGFRKGNGLFEVKEPYKNAEKSDPIFKMSHLTLQNASFCSSK